MKRFLCCLKGGSSSNAAQGNDENDEVDVERLFGNNERLNHLWRNHLRLPDDREVAGSVFVSLLQSLEIEISCFLGFLYLTQLCILRVSFLLLRFGLVTFLQVKVVSCSIFNLW